MILPAYSPGPWRVIDCYSDLEIVTDWPTRETQRICGFRGQTNSRANAPLIAAAPELLDCARAFLAFLDGSERKAVSQLVTKATRPALWLAR